jgi:multiple sugar transport system substrate-binding protein
VCKGRREELERGYERERQDERFWVRPLAGRLSGERGDVIRGGEAMRKLTRRDFLKGTATVAGATLARPALGAAPSGKLTAWGLQNFAAEGDKLIAQQMQDFGRLKNIQVEYVIVPANEASRKLAAAIEAKATPDLVMLTGQNVQYYQKKGLLVELTDVLDYMKGQPGGIVEATLPQAMTGGKAYGISIEIDNWILHVRTDVFRRHGINLPITTWSDFTEACKKINNPPNFYAWGMTLGRCSDAHVIFLAIMWAHGGKLVEADGKTVALKSEGTLAALKLIAQWYQKDKIIPPDSVTGDDAWNNKMYQSKMVGVVDNPASIYRWLELNDKELWQNTTLMDHPRGPAGSFSQVGSQTWVIFNTSRNVELAKEMIRYWMEPSRYGTVVENMGGKWWPIYKNMAKLKYFTDRPAFTPFPEIMANGRLDSYAGPPSDASGEVFERLIYPDMVQRVVVGGETPEKALDWAHDQVREIYSRYFK